VTHPLDWEDEDSLRGFEQAATEEQDAIITAFAGSRVAADGSWVRTPCPLCLQRTGKSDKHGACGYSPNTGAYHCFKCGLFGRLPAYLRERVATLAPSEQVRAILERGPVEQAHGFIPLFAEPGLSVKALEPARQYLTARYSHLQAIHDTNSAYANLERVSTVRVTERWEPACD
jgi:hypothetical protein